MPRCFDFFAGLRRLWQFSLSLLRGSRASIVPEDTSVLVIESDSEEEQPVTAPSVGSPSDWWLVDTAPEPSPAVLALAGSLRRGAEGPHHIALAYLRGRQAALIRRGELGAFHGPRCNLRNRYYVVLSTGQSSEAFYTRSYNIYNTAVKYSNGNFDVQSISHGFASESEVRAFCLGAGLETLPRFR